MRMLVGSRSLTIQLLRQRDFSIAFSVGTQQQWLKGIALEFSFNQQ